jgi:methyl-accepting chemotaxis protein
MRPLALSFRQKILLPSLVAAAATLIATAVSSRLSSSAADELRRVEVREFPTLQLFQDLEAGLARVQRQLEEAAAQQDPSALAAADALHEDLLARLAAAPRATVGEDRTGAIADALRGWYAPARARVERRVRGEATPDGEATGLQVVAARFVSVRDAIASETRSAREAMAQGFEAARTLQRRAIVVSAIILLAAAIGSAALASVLAWRLARPVLALNRAALRIADGDLTVFGVGGATHDLDLRSGDEVGTLASSFRRMTDRLRQIVGALKVSSTELGRAAERLAEHARAQNAILERQAAGVSETSATTRELEQTSAVAASRAASVLDVARRASEMSSAGQSAAEESVEGLRRIQASVQEIFGRSSRLLDQTQQVSDIVESVRDLSVQSHVLSMNASIEAARAGESGKGFGVVAAEVRALAEQSGQSAGRIAKIVEDIVGAVRATLETTESGTRGMEGSVARIRASGESLRDIGAFVRETGDAALQIATAVQQQSQGVAQIAGAMRELDRGMEETVARVQVLQGAAQDLTATAARISAIADGFRV